MSRLAILVVLVLLLAACGTLTADGTGVIYRTADPHVSIGVRLLAPPTPPIVPAVAPEPTATVDLMPTVTPDGFKAEK